MIHATTQLLARFLAGALTAVLIVVLVLATPAGSRWLLDTALSFSAGTVSASGVKGSILEGLTIGRLQVRAGRTSVEIEEAELGVAWLPLLANRLELDAARARRVQVVVVPRPPGEPATPVEPLLLPLPVTVAPLTLDELVVISGDGEPLVLRNVVLAGTLESGVLRFRHLEVQAAGVSATASGAFATGEPFALQADLRWRLADPLLEGAGRLAGSLAALRIEQVLKVPEPVALGAFATLLDDQPRIAAELRWRELVRELPGVGPVASREGTLKLRGWVDGYELELATRGRLRDRVALELALAGAGDAASFTIGQARLAALGGEVTATGQIVLAAPLTGQLRVAGRRLDPGPLDPRFAGQVDFAGSLRFGPGAAFAAALQEASGTLFRRPFRASGRVTRRDADLLFDDIRVVAGQNRLELAGRWGTTINGRFRIEAPELGLLWPDLSGTLRGSGTLGGTLAKPVFQLELDGASLAAGDWQLAALRARGGLGPRDALDLRVTATGLRNATRLLGDLQLAVDGRLPAHEFRLSLEGGQATASLAGQGGFRDGVLSEEIRAGRVDLRRGGDWVLQGSLPLRLAGTQLKAGSHCWTSDPAELCVSDASASPAGFQAGLRLRQLPLNRLADYRSSGVTVAGRLDADVEARREGGRLTGSLRAALEGAALTYRTEDGDEVTARLNEGRLTATATDEAVDFSGVLTEGSGLDLRAAGRITDPFGAAPTIAADLGGGIPDLATLGPLVEPFLDIGDLRGSVDVRVGLSGAVGTPDITGGIELNDGALTVPAAGITVDRIRLAILGGPDGTARIEGLARSGKGYVALDGNVAWRDRLVPAAEFSIKGRVFDVIRIPEGYVQVSPDVRVVLEQGQFRVRGDMHIPRGSIRLKEIATGAVQPSPDTVVHGREAAAAAARPPLFVLDGLAVRLGDKVTFEGFGLKTALSGGLTLSQSVAADPNLVVGQGVVTLKDGRFVAFGQTLAIERGSLIFAGPVTDPGLDVKAVREVTYAGREVTVGVLLSGNLSRIQPRIYSQPAMGELDALSYLTTGRPLSAASEGDRFSVAGAALSLGLNTALPLAQQIGTTLQLDEVGLGSSDDGGAAVVVGEQLGKNLYVRTSYGVFDRLILVHATYKLNRWLSIEGTTGGRQAVDLIYSVNW